MQKMAIFKKKINLAGVFYIGGNKKSQKIFFFFFLNAKIWVGGSVNQEIKKNRLKSLMGLVGTNYLWG